jgi:predicted neuraminidase
MGRFGLLAVLVVGAPTLAQVPSTRFVEKSGSSMPAAVWPAPNLPHSAANTRFSVLARGHIPMPANTPAAHASSLVAMPDDSPATVLAFWFAGQRESAPDVQIAFSWFDRATQAWQPARFVVNKDVIGAQLGFGLRRLGNPVGWRDAQGRIHLFVVATGLGGWAAGRVLHLMEKSGLSATSTSLSAIEFEAVRVLPLSWLWNTSHLVRNAPLPLADGGMVLPLYFELGVKYPTAARFGPAGEFLGLTRLSARGTLLQPALVMQDPTHWLAFLREHGPGRRVAVAATSDAGQTWQDRPDASLPNPDAAVAGLGLSVQLMVLAYNPSTTGRQQLRLGASANGLDWQTVADLAQGDAQSEFSYPALSWAGGNLWVSYTDQRQRIAWVRLGLKTTVGGKP